MYPFILIVTLGFMFILFMLIKDAWNRAYGWQDDIAPIIAGILFMLIGWGIFLLIANFPYSITVVVK